MTAIHPIAPLNQAMPKAQASAPIGIFDSGIGGLSVAIEIAAYLPNERIRLLCRYCARTLWST